MQKSIQCGLKNKVGNCGYWAVMVVMVVMFLANNLAFAGTGWYVTFHNYTNVAVTITYAGNDQWFCNDFCGPQTVAEQQSATFYTEEYLRGPAIQSLYLNGPYPARVEFWTAVPRNDSGSSGWVEHSHLVSYNIQVMSNNTYKREYVGSSTARVVTDILVLEKEGSYGTVYADVNILAI